MKIYNVLALVLMILLIGVSACSTSGDAQTGAPTSQVEPMQRPQGGDNQQAGSAQGGDRQQKMMAMCPMQVEGTTREVIKLDNAVAMEFTTTGDVEELRERVQAMAEMRENKMHGEGGMHGEQGQMKHGGMHGGMQGEMSEEQREMREQMKEMMSGVTVGTEPVDNGMRVLFTPNDTAQNEQLYDMMKIHSQMMEDHGQCPMMM